MVTVCLLLSQSVINTLWSQFLQSEIGLDKLFIFSYLLFYSPILKIFSYLLLFLSYPLFFLSYLLAILIILNLNATIWSELQKIHIFDISAA